MVQRLEIINHPKYSLKRAIELLWEKSRISIYGTEKFSKEKEAEIAKEMQCINLAYALAKEKFQGKVRDNNQERYFEHLREVANIIINREISDDVSIFSIVVALLHDIIEDTDVDAPALEKLLSSSIGGKRGQDFAKRVSQAITDLSKNNWLDYIVSPIDKGLVKTIETKTKHSLTDSEVYMFGKDKLEKSVYTRYYEIKENAKDLRNHDYFSKMDSLDDDILNIKFADRIHNLRTQWTPENTKQVIKKIQETKIYFLPVAKKRNAKAYSFMQDEINILEEKLGYSVEISQQIDRTKSWFYYATTGFKQIA